MVLNCQRSTLITARFALAMLSMLLPGMALSQVNGTAASQSAASRTSKSAAAKAASRKAAAHKTAAHKAAKPVVHKAAISKSKAYRIVSRPEPSNARPVKRTPVLTAIAATRARTSAIAVKAAATTRKGVAGGVHAVRVVARRGRRLVERFTASSYADDVTLGDLSAGEDPVVRNAAIQALGNLNGTALRSIPRPGEYWRW